MSASAQASSKSASALHCEVVSRGTHGENVTHTEAVWKFSITASGCYNGQRVIRPGATCSVWHTDPITIISNGCSVQDNIYAWRGNPYGGYYAQAQATFQNCIIKFACVTSTTVTLMIWITGNGAWISAVKS